LVEHHLCDGHEFVSFGFVPCDQAICSQHGLRTVGAKGFVASIVEKDHVAAPHLLIDFLFDVVFSLFFPIPARNPPHDRLEPQLARDPKGGGPAPTERGTKKQAGIPNRVSNGLLTSFEFHSGPGFRGKNQVGMGKRVIPHHVSQIKNLTHNIGSLCDIAADQKESSVHAVFGKNFQEAERMRVVWTIIVGECELARATRKTNQAPPIPLSLGGHRLIAGYEGHCARGAADDVADRHAPIVTAAGLAKGCP